MGCTQSSPIDDEAKARNDEIENQLKRDRMLAKNEIKMLLLGAGESGKSTVLKQMKLIHHGGYNDQERDSYKEIIFSNTIQSMRAILEAMTQLDIPLSPQNDARRSIILSLPPQLESDVLPGDVADALKGLWRDPGVREAVRRSREYQLNDSATYYFNSLDRMSSPGYMPTDQDILRSRVKTTGITETTFQVGELTYRLFDVGGQRSERKKWIHCFENVTALVFLVSLSEYDQMLYEDESVNRMQEALTLFDSICNSRWFVKTSIILFLNKIDLFAEKLPRSPLGDYFPDYTGGDNYDAACAYLLNRFVSLNQSAQSKQIYAHYTCATDTQQIKFVLSAIQDILLQLHLRECGLL
ncbi:heterotrimeric G protein alpha subunit B [Panus rudis PR-1116 ss-1]|nr:heterotrimeric G protein alpha subunit B [Panus rudis PR-1116 ss-1]